MYLTVKQAAERLGVDGSRVRQLILSGALVAERFGWLWLIQESVVSDYQQTRRPYKKRVSS